MFIYKTKSSAKRRTDDLIFSRKSLIKMRNKTGPKTDPWVTPDRPGTGSEAWPSKSNRKAMNRNWSNQKANPALKTKAGNK